MPINIPIRDNSNHSFLQVLDNKTYKFDFLYNSIGDFWTFDLYDDNDNLIVGSVKIIANYPLLFYFAYDELPDGDIFCEIYDKTKRINRNSFVSGEAKLYYLTREEIEAL